jgi:hypothetical protein
LTLSVELKYISDIGVAMSDGPHRSLPMRRGWKRVAEWADNQAFESEQVCHAIIPALEEDWRGEVGEEFIGGLRRACVDQESLLFKRDALPALEALRDIAGSGIGRVALDYAIRAAATGSTGLDIAESAMKDALKDRAARCLRQVEEHYCRESSMTRGNTVRGRIERAINSADIGGAARRLFSPETKNAAAQSLKREGLDDGVKL